jgi:hypothetical protein
MEKLRSDFNSSGKNAVDRIAQIRIGINDVPYDVLPRVIPAMPTGYQETAQDTENAWGDLIVKFKSLILSSFDLRVGQYEEDIKERDAQRSLPGWNFCTFFILKEGLARGFESVGLVEDALVGYDELSVGLDTIIQEQAAGAAVTHAGVLLNYTDELKKLAYLAVTRAGVSVNDADELKKLAYTQISTGKTDIEDDEAVDLQATPGAAKDQFKDIPISAAKKPYRELILANNVSVFDFRCYIFARQISLLLRLGNAWSTREELLAKLREQQEAVLPGLAPRVPPPIQTDDSENLSMLAEICRRTLEFIPAVSQVMRRDIISAVTPLAAKSEKIASDALSDPVLSEVVDNIVASFAFSVAQQILAQTSTKALPIPPSALVKSDGQEQKTAIPEPKTMMHPARSSSLHIRPTARGPPSPGIFPGGTRRSSVPEAEVPTNQFLKVGLEELAARRAELYSLSRNILQESGSRRGWTDGWASVPIVGDDDIVEFEDISLDDDGSEESKSTAVSGPPRLATSLAGIENDILRAALDNKDDFYRLYETLTDKALRHSTVASHSHSVKANWADLAVLKFHLEEYNDAAEYFALAIPLYGISGWSLLELSMLVMFARCLTKLQQRDKYVTVVLTLLAKAAAAEMDRQLQKTSLQSRSSTTSFNEALRGFLGDLLSASEKLEKEKSIPLENYFYDVEIQGSPIFDDGQDSFSLTLRLRSLFIEDFEAQQVSLKIVSPAINGNKEIWLHSQGPLTIKPGKNMINLRSFVVIPGDYEVDQVVVNANKLSMNFRRTFGQPVDKVLAVLRHPRVSLHQRASCLDVELSSAKSHQLDKNNSLELDVLSGWNDITNCEVRIKAASGGLRLMMAEAKVLGSISPTGTPEGGVFAFGSIPANSSLTIRFPFTVEQDLVNVAVKVEVSYTTERGTFTLVKTPTVPISLALGVNVQDVFKHHALFSRFTVSTASSSPLRLFQSELLESDLFESHFGIPPEDPVMVFPKQPASLLYKITRKPGSRPGPQSQKLMYLKLYYSVLYDEIDELIRQSMEDMMKESQFSDFSTLVCCAISSQLQSCLSDYDLERSALVGELQTSFLAEVAWTKHFIGLGKSTDGGEVALELSNLITEWQRQHPIITIPEPDLATIDPRIIIIPVDIPSIRIVHTADIRLQEGFDVPAIQTPDIFAGGGSGVSINQLLPATLHLKWTRIWDTDIKDNKGKRRASSTTPAAAAAEDDDDNLEFSYEVNAPADTWLVGGRRKGHFVIPPSSGEKFMTSTSATEADIPLLLVPLREGWLPYPMVEIRGVKSTPAAANDQAPNPAQQQPPPPPTLGYSTCETDYRNLGETVQVIADRAKVTLSLDASGPGGGPLVLESERLGIGGRVVA